MTKQEKVREGMIEIAEIQTQLPRPICESMVDLMLSRQSFQGVVIKVDKGCNTIFIAEGKSSATIPVKLLERAGYVAVEPLIEVKK